MSQRLTAAVIAAATLTIGWNIWSIATTGNTERQSDFRAEIVDITSRTVALTTPAVVSRVATSPSVKKIPQQRVVTYRERKPARLTAKELDCLARNIYFEAGVENRAGKLAVAQVTLNRRDSGRWGRDVCSVVYARAQFSWTLSKDLRNKRPSGELWEQSRAVANEFASGVRIKNLEDTTHYYSDIIPPPAWANTMRVSHKIGQHTFFQRI
jgi:spore germination cell wall hydrolase CwlJ-like protein